MPVYRTENQEPLIVTQSKQSEFYAFCYTN